MILSRRTFIGALAASSFGIMQGCALSRPSNDNRPNFLMLLSDDMGYGDPACYGNPIIETPNIDRLALQGLRLTDCYAAAPMCSPARAAIMTGRNSYRCNIPDWISKRSSMYLGRDEVTIATLLRNAGYSTSHCGKWHLLSKMDGSQPTPGDHGFDHWFSTQNNAYPTHKNPINFVRNGQPVGPIEGYSSSIIADEAIRFLNSNREKPFALFVCFHSPHEPIASAPEFMERYASEPIEAKRAYYGNVTQLDHEIGRILQVLDSLRLQDNTLVYFTSDNGPEILNNHKNAWRSYGSTGSLRKRKHHLYEGGIRVPGILRWPRRIQPGNECDEPVNGTDVLPTLCELAGIEVPDDRHVDGTSITPIFEGQELQRKRPLYWRYDQAMSTPKAAMRIRDWKILANEDWSVFELYNLKEDPYEKNDLADQAPERLNQMKEELRSIHLEIDREYAEKKSAQKT